MLSSFFLHEENELASRDVGVQERVAGLLAKGLEILHRARIRGEDFQDLSGRHIGERFFRAQYRKRTIQAACIELFVELHCDASEVAVV